MITTGTSVTVTKVLPKGVVTAYTTGQVSLYVNYRGVLTRYNAASITNSTATVDGVITFNSVACTLDGSYTLHIVNESVADLDTNAVTSTTIGRGFFQKATNNTTIALS